MFKVATKLLFIMILLTGFIYPVVVTGVVRILFPDQSTGSMITQNGVVIGSKLIGQYFDDPHYFWGRPSATPFFPYNAASSSGSNMGPSNPEYLATVKKRVEQLRASSLQPEAKVPVDLVTASGSGLDPEISIEAAYYQIPRIAAARHLTVQQLKLLVDLSAKKRLWGILGERRVNVLLLNLKLNSL